MRERPRLQLVKFEPRHLNAVEARADFQAERCMAGDQPRRAELAWSVTRAGFPVACGGLFLTGQLRRAVWGYAAPLSPREWAWVARKAATVLSAANAMPTQATCRADAPRARSFLEHLGFALERELPGYGPGGADYLLMLRPSEPLATRRAQTVGVERVR